jgi:hypothetical protein
MLEIVIVLGVILAAIGISWGVNTGFVYLICLCFNWEFSVLMATGVWLVLSLIAWHCRPIPSKPIHSLREKR